MKLILLLCLFSISSYALETKNTEAKPAIPTLSELAKISEDQPTHIKIKETLKRRPNTVANNDVEHGPEKATSDEHKQVTKKAVPHNDDHKIAPKAAHHEASNHQEESTKTSPAHAAHTPSKEPVSAETSLGWLKNGNIRYIKNHVRKDGRSAKDRTRLASGQTPHAIVLSCSDSRVPPETIFDQSLGEIFTIRVAGEALDSSVIASIEYAVSHLGTQLILVMGHTSCGAVKAALSAKNGESSGSPSLDKLVADIKPRLPEGRSPASSSKDLTEESTANAHGVAEDLVKRSSIIKDLVNSGKLTIKSSLYNLKTGEVSFE